MVAERRHKKIITGTLEKDKRPTHSNKYLLLQPFDKSFPKISVALDQLESKYHDCYENYVFKVNIENEWQITSPFPFGSYLTCLGEKGALESELQIMLVDCEVRGKWEIF